MVAATAVLGGDGFAHCGGCIGTAVGMMCALDVGMMFAWGAADVSADGYLGCCSVPQGTEQHASQLVAVMLEGCSHWAQQDRRAAPCRGPWLHLPAQAARGQLLMDPC